MPIDDVHEGDLLPPGYLHVGNNHWMTLDDICNERKWFQSELQRVKGETFTLNRQLQTARSVNTTLLDDHKVLLAQLAFYKRTWAVRLDTWLRVQAHKFNAWSWRVRDAWEVLNGRYSE